MNARRPRGAGQGESGRAARRGREGQRDRARAGSRRPACRTSTSGEQVAAEFAGSLRAAPATPTARPRRPSQDLATADDKAFYDGVRTPPSRQLGQGVRGERAGHRARSTSTESAARRFDEVPECQLSAGSQLSTRSGSRRVPPTAAGSTSTGCSPAPARSCRMGGTARVSIVVDAAWRVRVLVAEFSRARARARPGTRPTVEGHSASARRTRSRLAPLGARWLRGAVKRPPPDFAWTGGACGCGCAAAGAPPRTATGTRCELGADDARTGTPVGAALAAAGLPAALLGPGAGGPAYRIDGPAPAGRLAELVGDRPATHLPRDCWPGCKARTDRGRRLARIAERLTEARPAPDVTSVDLARTVCTTDPGRSTV